MAPAERMPSGPAGDLDTAPQARVAASRQESHVSQDRVSQNRRPQSPSFFTALFDLSFRNFITVKCAGVLYGLGLAGILVAWGLVSYLAYGQSSTRGITVAVLGLPASFLAAVVLRILLEMLVALIRTAQNTTLLVDLQD